MPRCGQIAAIGPKLVGQEPPSRSIGSTGGGLQPVGLKYTGHNYIGLNYTGHNYIGHTYKGHKYIGHTDIGPTGGVLMPQA